MHTKITLASQVIWLAVIAGQLIVDNYAWRRRNLALAGYLSAELVITLTLLAVARLGSPVAYYRAYCVGCLADYLAEAFLVVMIFAGIRSTGIPNKNHPTLLQIFAGGFFAIAILTMRFPLSYIFHPEWKWVFAVDHVVNYWLCLMLVLAPAYAYLIDSAKDTRLLLTYVGFALYVGSHSAAVDFAIYTHLVSAAAMAHIPDIVYLVSLVVWFFSCRYSFQPRQMDHARIESLKSALRERRSNVHSLSER